MNEILKSKLKAIEQQVKGNTGGGAAALPVSAAALLEDHLAAFRRGETPASVPVLNKPARLLFALDLTGSRQQALRQARIATAGMFDAIRAIGNIFVKLVYFRGAHECKASGWMNDADALTGMMLKLGCKAGVTQIARVFRVALCMEEKPDAVIFVGDCFEDDADEVMGLAGRLGALKIPVYVFHERDEAAYVEPDGFTDVSDDPTVSILRDIAAATKGVYVPFTPNSGDTLRELLATLAAFSTAGRSGVQRLPQAVTKEAKQLQATLLALPAPQSR